MKLTTHTAVLVSLAAVAQTAILVTVLCQYCCLEVWNYTIKCQKAFIFITKSDIKHIVHYICTMHCNLGCGRQRGVHGDFILVQGAVLNRIQAQDACAALGMQLANLQSVQKYEEVVTFLGKFSYEGWHVWIGGSLKDFSKWSADIAAWKWSDGTGVY